MTKLLLKCSLSPGDIVMLTAAVRDLHQLHPGKFVTDVRTSCPELWEHNPRITPLEEDDPKVTHIQCHYPLIQRANQEPWHFLHGYSQYLGQQLGIDLHPTAFRGDIHLSPAERKRPSPAKEVHGDAGSYWIIVAGGKYDYTIKWWHRRRWQEVVDRLQDRITFVQVGGEEHYHPPLRGVIDMRGKTTLRELVRLVYWSEGVLSPVTSLPHLAAAVPLPPHHNRERPCVVVAGGREPPHWEAYPWHRFLHTVGSLPCCKSGGCWKSRAVPLGDGSEHDEPKKLCKDFSTAAGLPQCMDLISPDHVIAAINTYIHNDKRKHLDTS